MCESVRKYAEKLSQKSAEESRINTLVQNVKVLMKNASFTMDQAFTNLEVSDSDRAIISSQLQK